MPAGTTVADVLLTLAQQLPPQLTIVFEVSDAAGNISAPATLVTTIVEVKTGDIQVSISWDVDNDIDLHVVDPNEIEIYYGDVVSPEGGELDLDSNAACDIDKIDNENILWPIGKAPAGTYTVQVDNYDNCQSKATNYVVTVQKKGQPPQTFMGNCRGRCGPGDRRRRAPRRASRAGRRFSSREMIQLVAVSLPALIALMLADVVPGAAPAAGRPFLRRRPATRPPSSPSTPRARRS